jgi:hypothetical protein
VPGVSVGAGVLLPHDHAPHPLTRAGAEEHSTPPSARDAGPRRPRAAGVQPASPSTSTRAATRPPYRRVHHASHATRMARAGKRESLLGQVS